MITLGLNNPLSLQNQIHTIEKSVYTLEDALFEFRKSSYDIENALHNSRNALKILRKDAIDSIKVSAICVTKRISKLNFALRWFKYQTYFSKELIIVTDRNNRHKKLLNNSDVDVKFVYADGTLGHLRNIGIEHASGTYVIQWDDDDMMHPV